MRMLIPQFLQRCVFHATGRSGRMLMLAIAWGLIVALQAPLDAAEQPSKGGTIIWAVHEGMPHSTSTLMVPTSSPSLWDPSTTAS
jgi:hypothetical protein